MKVKIETDGFKIWKPLQDHAEEKIKKITELHPLTVELLLKESDGEFTNKKSEIRVKIKGHEFFAENVSDTFENSINKVISKVRKQMLKTKDKKIMRLYIQIKFFAVKKLSYQFTSK